MILLQPIKDIIAETTGEVLHFLRFAVRDQAGSFVATDVAFFPKGIQTADKGLRRTDCESKRLNHAVVMLVPARAVSLGREGGGRGLKCRVVRDAQLPVGAQVLGGAIGEIALDDGEQAFDFLGARPVGMKPAVLSPFAQAHRSLPR